MGGTEGEWFIAWRRLCRKQAGGQLGFSSVITESDTGWVEKEGAGERLASYPCCSYEARFTYALPLPISIAVYAAYREAASSGHSQGTEAWALRNICGCLIAEVR